MLQSIQAGEHVITVHWNILSQYWFRTLCKALDDETSIFCTKAKIEDLRATETMLRITSSWQHSLVRNAVWSISKSGWSSDSSYRLDTAEFVGYVSQCIEGLQGWYCSGSSFSISMHAPWLRGLMKCHTHQQAKGIIVMQMRSTPTAVDVFSKIWLIDTYVTREKRLVKWSWNFYFRHLQFFFG